MSYQYRVIPFIGQIKGDKFTMDSARQVAAQLEELIAKNTKDGWEYYRIDKVSIQINPGCLAALFGSKSSVIDFDQVVFRKAL